MNPELWIPEVLEINIERRDIKKGQTCLCHKCAVARAFQRATNRTGEWTIEWGTVEFGNLECTYEPLDEWKWFVRMFIERFDKERKVKPFTFTVKLKRKTLINQRRRYYEY